MSRSTSSKLALRLEGHADLRGDIRIHPAVVDAGRDRGHLPSADAIVDVRVEGIGRQCLGHDHSGHFLVAHPGFTGPATHWGVPAWLSNRLAATPLDTGVN